MRYVSTRAQAPVRDFAGVLLAGLAEDGGLYVPETWPTLSPAEWRGLRGLPYPALAARLLAPFVGDAVPADALEAICRDAYAGFDHPAVVPLVQLDTSLFVQELFHGPTLAFKDVPLQVLGRLFDRVLTERDARITIVGATSGDTGSAAIAACAGRARVDIVILHPRGRTSEVQRRQMTTVDAPNVANIAVEGTFDDCQDLVKAMFADADFRAELRLSAVNSINWARIAAQVPYYAAAALALGAPDRKVAFSVPTGNFGNVYAGHIARRADQEFPGKRILESHKWRVGAASLRVEGCHHCRANDQTRYYMFIHHNFSFPTDMFSYMRSQNAILTSPAFSGTQAKPPESCAHSQHRLWHANT